LSLIVFRQPSLSENGKFLSQKGEKLEIILLEEFWKFDFYLEKVMFLFVVG